MRKLLLGGAVAALVLGACQTADESGQTESTDAGQMEPVVTTTGNTPIGEVDEIVTTAGNSRARRRSTRRESKRNPAPPPPAAATVQQGYTLGGQSAPVRLSDVAPRMAGGDYTLDVKPGTMGEGGLVTLQPDADGYVRIAAEYDTVQQPVIVQEATTEFVTIPEVRDGQGNILTPARTVERTVPAVTKMETRRVVTREAEEIFTGGEPVTRRLPGVRAPDSYILRDREGRVIREFASREEYAKWQPSPYKMASTEPVSTFSADVDTASYTLARQSLRSGRLPPPQSVRIEEMVNYFDYDYDVPRTKDAPFKPSIAVVPSPWNAETKLVHIGIKGYDVPARKRPPMNLVFLIDVSGSMQDETKLGLLKDSFNELVRELDRDDTVSIVTYSDTIDTPLIPTRGDRGAEIMRVVDQLEASGSTAGEAGLQTAYRVAEQSFIKDGTNRIILATDGDFNLGIDDPAELKSYIADKRKTGVYLSVLGFGRGNLQDDTMQALAQNGNGNAGYIDSRREAKKFFVQDMNKTLVPIADDVKIQVEFNPARVREYRLIGYETRGLRREDFNNDKVDAGDIGAGHTVTAIYEVVPTDAARRFVDPLRYQSDPGKVLTADSNTGEFGYVKLRYKLPGAKTSKLMERAITVDDEYSSIRRAPEDTRFATAVAGYGLALRGDSFADTLDLGDIARMAETSRGGDRYGYRAEFAELVREAAELKGRRAEYLPSPMPIVDPFPPQYMPLPRPTPIPGECEQAVDSNGVPIRGQLNCLE